nr:efflux RND transporter periplasmic adaptor subunit [Bacteroidota bacterium]
MRAFQLLLLVYVLCIFSSCKNKTETISPETKGITESVYASGTIKSQNQYQVFSKVSGILQTIFVKEGDTIKKGDALFQLNNDNARLSTDNARLAAQTADYINNKNKLEYLKNVIALARKKLATDSLLFERQKNLWQKNIGSKVDLEQKELNFDNAKTNLESAIYKFDDLQKQLKLASGQSKNNLNISKILQSDLLIKSEVNGRVYSILKEQNELVTSQTPIAVIGDATSFLVELNIDEHDIVDIKIGQQIIIRMDSYKDKVFEAKLTTLDPIMNERTRTFKAEASFETKPETLYPGLSVEANIVISTKPNALTIPRSYLINDTTVMLENGELQNVKTGLMDYDYVEITSGISSTSKLILPKK